MKASAENVFVGASIKKGEENFTVVKANAKTMYVAKMTTEEYNRALVLKAKGETFKDFCKKLKIKMVKYDGFEIDEKEASKKAVIEEAKSSPKTSALGKAEKMVLKELLKYNKIHRFQNIGVGDKIMRVLENRENNYFLLNVNNDYILWNKELDSSYYVCSVFDYEPNKTVFPWEKITPKGV